MVQDLFTCDLGSYFICNLVYARIIRSISNTIVTGSLFECVSQKSVSQIKIENENFYVD